MSDQNITGVLLDTNAFLFFIKNDPALSKTAKILLESEVDVFLSYASLWEIAIKYSIGKLILPRSFEDFVPEQMRKNDIEILPLAFSHLEKVSSLPFHHKDPFDRFIIAQSLVDNIAVITSDQVFESYGVERFL